MEAKIIFNTLDRIDSLPTLPAIAMEMNKMLLDFDTSVSQLSNCVEKDQAMVSKILKLVNSAFFGLRGRVSSIPHAVVILGFNTIRNAVVSISIIDTFCTKKALEGFDFKNFWKHSVAVAVTSKYLAEKTRIHPADDCFVGGLLHDMGKIVLAQHFNDLFQKVWLAAKDGGKSFYDAEKSEISVDHARIGGYLAQKWQLPAGLVDAVRYHHAVSPNAHDLNLLMAVHTANIIVNTYGTDPKTDLELSDFHPEALKSLGRQCQTVADWYPEVSLEIESACKFFIEESK